MTNSHHVSLTKKYLPPHTGNRFNTKPFGFISSPLSAPKTTTKRRGATAPFASTEIAAAPPPPTQPIILLTKKTPATRQQTQSIVQELYWDI
ncbi:hypothetical protein Pelo_19876 [Pelomyxa schiedti]|nr:hypothetical protein Pelo_19876 [Pelomyxa schiedti]